VVRGARTKMLLSEVDRKRNRNGGVLGMWGSVGRCFGNSALALGRSGPIRSRIGTEACTTA
jgi:hypothetical protein